jgi:hexulose-6-phosphate isomerase
MEWTLDQVGLHANPLMTPEGRQEIGELCKAHRLRVSSLTGDCFMQAPFWKARGATRTSLLDDFRAVAQACAAVGATYVVVPLVDNGRLDDRNQEDRLVGDLLEEAAQFQAASVKIVFEIDYGPQELARFIERLPATSFGVNYDIGNSASLGFDPVEELSAYGHRVDNVHVKDRLLHGTTVPLGTGNADFNRVFTELARLKYRGNYILQTARAADGDHVSALVRYRDMVASWIEKHGA